MHFMVLLINGHIFQVLVILTDVNDNAPKFSRKEYYVQIFETMRVDYDIIQLFSTDRDIGENARSYYYKIPDIGTDTQGRNLFDLFLILVLCFIQLWDVSII